jgi:hypothetical protein
MSEIAERSEVTEISDGQFLIAVWAQAFFDQLYSMLGGAHIVQLHLIWVDAHAQTMVGPRLGSLATRMRLLELMEHFGAQTLRRLNSALLRKFIGRLRVICRRCGCGIEIEIMTMVRVGSKAHRSFRCNFPGA